MEIDLKKAIYEYNKDNNLEDSNEEMTLKKLSTKIKYKSRNAKTLQSDLSQFGNGNRNCPIIILKQICKILECSADVILKLY